MIIYRASEFGICRNLRSALLYFFAFTAKDNEINVILSVIFREVDQSSSAHNLLRSMYGSECGSKEMERSDTIVQFVSWADTSAYLQSAFEVSSLSQLFYRATAFLKARRRSKFIWPVSNCVTGPRTYAFQEYIGLIDLNTRFIEYWKRSCWTSDGRNAVPLT